MSLRVEHTVPSMDPNEERKALDKLMIHSLSFSLLWIYDQLHKNTMDFEKFETYVKNSEIARFEYPHLIEALDDIKKDKSANHLGSCLQSFFKYINDTKKNKKSKFLDQLGTEEEEPSQEMEYLFKRLHFDYSDQLYCIDFQMNASFTIQLSKKNKFIEIENGGRVSCIIISANKKEAYEIFQLSESTPMIFNGEKVTIYGVRFNISGDVDDIFTRVFTSTSRIVRNKYLES